MPSLRLDPQRMSSFSRELYEAEKKFLHDANQERSFSGKVANGLVGRALYLGISIATHAEAVFRAAAACFFFLRSFFSKGSAPMFRKQVEECKEAYSVCIHSVIACFYSSVLARAEIQQAQHQQRPLHILSKEELLPEELNRREKLEQLVQARAANPHQIPQAVRAAARQDRETLRASQQLARERAKNLYKLSAPDNLQQKDRDWTKYSYDLSGLQIGVCQYNRSHNRINGEYIIEQFDLHVGQRIYQATVFGIIDAFTGRRAALFTKEKLTETLREELTNRNRESLADVNIQEAIETTFSKLHQRFLEKYENTKLCEYFAEKITDHTATATIILDLDNKLWIVNLGNGFAFAEDGELEPHLLVENDANEQARFSRVIDDGAPGTDEDVLRGSLPGSRVIGGESYFRTSPKIVVKDKSAALPGTNLFIGSHGMYEIALQRDYADFLVEETTSNPFIELDRLALDCVYSAWYSSARTDEAYDTNNPEHYAQMLQKGEHSLCCFVVRPIRNGQASVQEPISYGSASSGSASAPRINEDDEEYKSTDGHRVASPHLSSDASSEFSVVGEGQIVPPRSQEAHLDAPLQIDAHALLRFSQHQPMDQRMDRSSSETSSFSMISQPGNPGRK